MRQQRKRPLCRENPGVEVLIAAGLLYLHPHRLCDADAERVSFADGTRMRPSTILWCTGLHPDYRWISIPGVLDATGSPLHVRGVSPVPGLHWLGLPWQTRVNSSLIIGVDYDAKHLTARLRPPR